MKAVILAAGEGKRCRPLTRRRSKVMLPVANKPIIEYVIEALRANGITEIVLVVGYRKERVMDYFEDGVKFDVDIEYVEQSKPLGTAHALKQAQSLVGDEFLVLNGDNIVDPRAVRDLLGNNRGESDATILTVMRDEIKGYGALAIEKEKVTEIVEKPKGEFTHFVNTGVYLFKDSVFRAIDRTEISERGEFELTSALQEMIEGGMNVLAVKTDGLWEDVVHSWDLVTVNSAILAGAKRDIKGHVEEGATLKGPVVVGENTLIRAGTYIIGPVVIGRDCEIGPNATVFPSTSIGNNVVVRSHGEIQNSVIMNDVRIGSNSVVSDSVIGYNNVIGTHFSTETRRGLSIEIEGMLHHAEVMGTVLGDNNQVGDNVLVKAGRIIDNDCSIASANTIDQHIESNSKVI